jgi:hypothetical protein
VGVAALRIIGKVIAFLGVLALLAGLMLHFRIASYAYLASAFAGSFVIHLWSRPRIRWRVAALVCGGVFAGAYAAVLGAPGLGALLAFLGLGSLASSAYAALWGGSSERQTSLDTCLAASMFPLFLVIAGFSLAVTEVAHPITYDYFLYAFDEQLGGQPSFLIGRLLGRSDALRQLCWLGYEGLPLAMAVTFGIERSQPVRRTPSILTAFMVAATGGFVLYNLYPATGPIHVFGSQFPYAPPPAGSPPFRLVAAGAAARNAMPSVHIAMALLILWNSRAGPKAWRWMARALLAVTVLATLGFGEHYLIDLFVALPFALLAQAVSASGLPWNDPARLAGAGTGALLVTGWLAYLRLPWPPLYGHGAIVWSLLLGTGIAALCMERGLERAAALVNQGQRTGRTATRRIMEACRP